MKKIFFILLMIFWAVTMVAPKIYAGETQYLAVLSDIPLMAQMQELTDSKLVFDKAEGRIVQETVRASNISSVQAESFYNESLPPLGWKKLTPSNTAKMSSRFSRNGEQLVVNLEKLGSEGLVTFAVSPIQP